MMILTGKPVVMMSYLSECQQGDKLGFLLIYRVGSVEAHTVTDKLVEGQLNA